MIVFNDNIVKPTAGPAVKLIGFSVARAVSHLLAHSPSYPLRHHLRAHLRLKFMKHLRLRLKEMQAIESLGLGLLNPVV